MNILSSSIHLRSHRRVRWLAFLTLAVLCCGPAVERLSARQSADLSETSVLHDLVYKKVGETELRVDLYLPKNVIGKPPVILCIHGGGWS